MRTREVNGLINNYCEFNFQLTIVFVWFLSALVSAPRLYFITTFEVPAAFSGSEAETEVMCAPMRGLYDARTLDMCNFVLLFLVPLLVISVLYAKIGRIIWRSSVVFQPEARDRPSVELSSCLLLNSTVQTKVVPHVPPNSVATEASSDEKHRNSENSYSIALQLVCENCSHGSKRAGFKTLFCIFPKGEEGPHQVYGGVTSSPTKDSANSVHSSGRHTFTHNSLGVNDEKQDFKCSSVEFAGEINAKLKLMMQKRAVDERLAQNSNQRIPPTAVAFIRNRRHRAVVRTRQAAIRMLIVIVITFALCNFPYHLRKICQYYVPNYNIHGSLNQFMTPITFLLMYTNCALNPILYAFMSKHFRSSFKDLLKLRLKKPNPTRRIGPVGF